MGNIPDAADLYEQHEERQDWYRRRRDRTEWEENHADDVWER